MKNKMEKSIVFDAGTLISLAMNDLLWTLKPLKDKFNGHFYITPWVKTEVIDNPLKSKRFKLEALNILNLLDKGILELYQDEDVRKKAEFILTLSNGIFKAKGNYIRIMHKGEVETLVLAKVLQSGVYAVDERTTRMLVEDPVGYKEFISRRLNSRIVVNKKNLERFRKEFIDINIIRSTELMALAYEFGILDTIINSESKMKADLLDGVLWGLKLRGCAISPKEIEAIEKIEFS